MARAAWPWRTPAPFRTAGCSACSWRMDARGWASWTRRWCTRPGRARHSCWAHPRGASSRSPATGCWCRPPRARRAPCPSGGARAWGVRTSSALRWAGWPARSRRPTRPRQPRASARTAGSTNAPQATWCGTCAIRSRRRAPCRATSASSSSASGTRSGTGACASSPPSVRACMRRGRWPSRPACARPSAPIRTSYGAMTASRATWWTATRFRRWTCCCPLRRTWRT